MDFSKMETFRVRGVVSMDEASQEDTEQSPEPSPMGPPAPQAFPALPTSARHETMQNNKHSPVGQHELFGERAFDNDDEDDESLPSLPDAPSPYSAPPASIFSGEEWSKQKQNRKTRNNSRQHPPLSEVRLQSSAPLSPSQSSSAYSASNARNGNGNDNDNDTFYSARSLEERMRRSLNQNPSAVPTRLSLSVSSSSSEQWSPQPVPLPIPTTPSEQRLLLPAVQSLKKDLHQSHQAMYLLQEENKALAAECDRFEGRLESWHNEADKVVAAAQDRELALCQKVDELNAQNQEVADMNQSLQERVNLYLDGTQVWLKEAEGKRDELERKLQKITREKEAATALVTNAQRENEQLVQELKEVKSKDYRGDTDRKVADEKVESLQKKNAELASRMGELKKETANKLKVSKLESEAETANKKKENSSLLLEIDRLKAMVKEQSRRGVKESAEVSANSVKLEEEVERLQTLLSESNGKAGLKAELAAELDAEVSDKKKQNSSLLLEIDRLKATLNEQSRRGAKETAEARSANLVEWEDEVERLQSLLRESNGKGVELTGKEKENSSLLLEIDRLKATLNEQSRRGAKETAEAKAGSAKLEEEVDRLQALLSESNGKGAELAGKEKENSSLLLEIDRLKATLNEQGRRGAKETAEAKAGSATLEEEVDRLQSLLSESNGKGAELAGKEKENSSLVLEIDRLKAVVKEENRQTGEASASTAKGEDEVERLQSLLRESNGKNSALRAEKLALRKELVQRHRSRHDVECQTDSIDEVVTPPTSRPSGVDAVSQTTGAKTLHAATQATGMPTLPAATQTNGSQTRHGATQTKSFGSQTTTIAGTKSFGSQTLYEDESVVHSNPIGIGIGGPVISSSQHTVTERLVRIRDAAERAALLQDSRREIDRLKAQHETEKESLKASHSESLKKVLHNAKSELSSKNKEYKRRLQSQYDAKVQMLESKHMKDLESKHTELTRVRCMQYFACCSFSHL
jgi:hypothetical protein